MGNKEGKHLLKSTGTELSDEEIELLQANTDMDRFTIIEWFEGLLKVYLLFIKLK
jgi:hypothetical protein